MCLSMCFSMRLDFSLRCDQHPLQMLLTFLSTMESEELSAPITSSPCILGPGVTVPSIRPSTAPPAGFPAVPTVVEPTGAPPALEVEPAELAVPAELVPGALDVALGALPTPLGSLPELLRPPTLAGPVTPLTAAVPPPAEPALGAPGAAPEVPPPADPPPADPPPPPPLCAKVEIGERRNATRSNLQGKEWGIGKLLLSSTPWKTTRSREPERIRRDRLEFKFCGVEFVMRKSDWTPRSCCQATIKPSTSYWTISAATAAPTVKLTSSAPTSKQSSWTCSKANTRTRSG
jgi:hypothetical protein